jgi:hypothetical protein
MIRIRQTFGAHSGRTREFNQDVVRFGRQPSNDVAFDPHADLDASGNHAELRREAGQWVLVDLGSRNGTLVQGRAIQRHVVRSGDEVEFGTGGPRIKIEIEEPPRRGAPTAPPTPLDLGGPSSTSLGGAAGDAPAGYAASVTPAPQWSRSPSSRPIAGGGPLVPGPVLTPPAGSGGDKLYGQRTMDAAMSSARGSGSSAGGLMASADRAAIEEAAARAADSRTRPLTYALIGMSLVLLGVICILGALVLYLMTR